MARITSETARNHRSRDCKALPPARAPQPITAGQIVKENKPKIQKAVPLA